MDAKQRETLSGANNPQTGCALTSWCKAKLLFLAATLQRASNCRSVMTGLLVQPLQRFIGKGADRYLMTSYERDFLIRPHAWPKV